MAQEQDLMDDLFKPLHRRQERDEDEDADSENADPTSDYRLD